MKSKTSEIRKPKMPVLHRLIRDMSSEAYHGTSDTWSSSQLKLVVEDEEEFIETYINKTIEKKSANAFDVGTFLHTVVLEPEKVEKECIVYPGKTRYGEAFRIFQAKHKGKVIISKNEKVQVDRMSGAIKKSPISMKYLKGEAEISLFVKLVVCENNIYCPHFEKKLTFDGWIYGLIPKTTSPKTEFIVKVRADMLGKNFISDVKSTSAAATKKDAVRQSISKYKYDLSAAFYLDLFSLVVPEVKDFIWIFASKDKPLAAAWRATSENIKIGRKKWMRGITRMASLKEDGWKIKDYLRLAEPLHHERSWLVEETEVVKTIKKTTHLL